MMDSFDQKQYDRVKQKLLYMNQVSPALVQLNSPWGKQDADGTMNAGTVFPVDYQKIVTEVADGGVMPPLFPSHYWNSTQLATLTVSSLQEPFPLTDSKIEAETDLFSLPGQLVLMGDRELSWSLIVTGPCRGEVWTMGSFGALRNPGCTFLQWLELVLDGNLPAYTFSFVTDREENAPRYRQYMELLRRKPQHSPEEDLAKRCDRWLEQHRKPIPDAVPAEAPVFHYEKKNPDSFQRKYLHDLLKLELSPPPEERGYRLVKKQIREEEDLPGIFSPKRIRWEDSKEMEELIRIADSLRAGTRPHKVFPHSRMLLQTAQELVENTKFSQNKSGVQNLSFILGATQLEHLYLQDNNVSDLTPLATLTKLQYLNLRNNDVSDLAPLAALTKLQELDLSYNQVSDLSPLSALPLCSLKLMGNHVTGLEPLQEMYTLNELNLRGCPLEPGALFFLRKCKRLRRLNLCNTGILDLRELESCTAWNLDLTGCPDLIGLEALASMKDLIYLSLDTTVAQRYDIRRINRRFTEYAELGGISVFTWPDKFYN